MDSKDLARLKHCAFGNLRRTSRAVSLYGDSVLQPLGLKVTQFTVLAAVATYFPLTVTELAERLLMDQTSVTRCLKPLKEAGLVESIRGEDGRTRLISITEQGNQKLDEVLPVWAQAQAHIVEGLGQDRFEALLKELSVVVNLVS